MRFKPIFLSLCYLALALPIAALAAVPPNENPTTDPPKNDPPPKNLRNCNTMLRKSSSYRDCSETSLCGSKAHKKGTASCGIYSEYVPGQFYYECQSGGGTGDDCVTPDTLVKCADVYECVNPNPIPWATETAQPCRKGQVTSTPKWTKNVAGPGECVPGVGPKQPPPPGPPEKQPAE